MAVPTKDPGEGGTSVCCRSVGRRAAAYMWSEGAGMQQQRWREMVKEKVICPSDQGKARDAQDPAAPRFNQII